ncbi:MAG: 50S ribosome-binding GTPase, partial [Acidobacteria bacterium]|nr:50S ribosome-binding GTPase [Acidobacteriota bacterium]
VREGARVVIVGPPNSGKSTLFNALLARERAIVTAAPGTTRDVLEADLEIEGLPVILVDTAGLREAADLAEAEGIRRAEQEEARADVILALHAADEGGAPQSQEVGDRRLDIVSKVDLANQRMDGILAISSVTGEGLDRLREEIHRRVSEPMMSITAGVAVNARHANALVRAREYLEGVLLVPREVAALEIRSGMMVLDEVLGEVDDEDVLEAVFSAFCVGK